MSEWLKKAFGGGEDAEQSARLLEAFKDGEREAQKFMRALTDIGQAYVKKGHPMEGTLVVFAGVLSAAGKAKGAVANDLKKHGSNSPIAAMWNLLEVALMAGSPEEGMAAVMKYGKDHP